MAFQFSFKQTTLWMYECGCIIIHDPPPSVPSSSPRLLLIPCLLSSPAERGSAETSEQQATARKIGNCRGGCFLRLRSECSVRLLRGHTLLVQAVRYLFCPLRGVLSLLLLLLLFLLLSPLNSLLAWAGRGLDRVSAAQAAAAVAALGSARLG